MEDRGTEISVNKESKSDLIAAIPAFLLCGVTAAMLVLDITLPVMSTQQYLIYPLFIRIVSAVSLACALITLIQDFRSGKTVIDASRALFIAFLVCVLISTAINGFGRDALMGVQYRYIGVFDMITLILAYMMCSGSIGTQALRKAVLISYMTAADVIAAAFISDRYLVIIEAFRNKREPAAIFFHGNHYGYFLVVAVVICAGLCLCVSGVLAVFSLLSMGLNLACLAINRSLGCIIAVGAIFTVSAVWIIIRGGSRRKRLLIPLAFTLAAAVLALVFSSALREDIQLLFVEIKRMLSGVNDPLSGYGRIGLWDYTIDLIKERPLWGYGCEGISSMLGDKLGYADNPHSEVLTYAAYYGIPASVLYSSAVIATVMKAVKASDALSLIAAAAAAGYFISSMFGVAMFYTVPFLFVLLGLAGTQSDADNGLLKEKF